MDKSFNLKVKTDDDFLLLLSETRRVHFENINNDRFFDPSVSQADRLRMLSTYAEKDMTYQPSMSGFMDYRLKINHKL